MPNMLEKRSSRINPETRLNLEMSRVWWLQLYESSKDIRKDLKTCTYMNSDSLLAQNSYSLLMTEKVTHS